MKLIEIIKPDLVKMIGFKTNINGIPEGMFRVVAIDNLSDECTKIGDYSTLKSANKKAEEMGESENINSPNNPITNNFYVFNSDGKYVGGDGDWNNKK